MLGIDLAKYIYIEYSVAVLLFSELAKLLLKKLPYKFIQIIAVSEPKYITLVVATVFAVVDYVFVGGLKSFNFWQITISFGLAVLGYDYGLKLIKDLFNKLREIWKPTNSPQ